MEEFGKTLPQPEVPDGLTPDFKAVEQAGGMTTGIYFDPTDKLAGNGEPSEFNQMLQKYYGLDQTTTELTPDYKAIQQAGGPAPLATGLSLTLPDKDKEPGAFNQFLQKVYGLDKPMSPTTPDYAAVTRDYGGQLPIYVAPKQDEISLEDYPLTVDYDWKGAIASVESIMERENGWSDATDLGKNLDKFKDVFVAGSKNIYNVSEPVEGAIALAVAAMDSLAADIASEYARITAEKERILEERRLAALQAAAEKGNTAAAGDAMWLRNS